LLSSDKLIVYQVVVLIFRSILLDFCRSMVFFALSDLTELRTIPGVSNRLKYLPARWRTTWHWHKQFKL